MAHAIRIRCKDVAEAPSRAEVEDTIAAYTRVLTERDTELRTVEPLPSASVDESYKEAIYRFDDAEDLSIILSEFDENLFSGVKWYIIESHICADDWLSDSDAPDGHTSDENCDDNGGWATENSRGNVPSSLQ